MYLLEPCDHPLPGLQLAEAISGSILERIDIRIEVPRVDYEKLSDDRLGDLSAAIQALVEAARDLATAIRSAHAGEMTISPEAVRVLVNTKLQNQEYEELTEREREVLNLMVNGLNNSEIADQLFVSLSTVKYHISNILAKLGWITVLRQSRLSFRKS